MDYSSITYRRRRGHMIFFLEHSVGLNITKQQALSNKTEIRA